ncbi:MAG: bifunctional folylpolyglutamate synthase/dihydrofolate synthase [Phycisphaeraceae bacterium]|nr:bifunctional folylpolyglutamate synthase/dihydrofolate synthase [Phycisphaeraceae bacterium]
MTRPAPKRRTAKTQPAPAIPEITTYPAALRHLLDRTNVERMRIVRYDGEMFKLDRMRALMAELGDPQNQVRMVHVAGTVGKGSTVAMIASMLEACGYAVGRYTSPHLIDLRERIMINGQPISRADLTEHTAQVSAAAARLGVEPTFFEMMTAIAFRHYAEQAVDIAVIEVGLGGRLDSTNIIRPEASVVTQIDLDHTQILGRTVTEIAREKAGIFKSGVPAFSYEQDPAVEKVLREEAEKAGTTLRIVGRDIDFSRRFGSDAERGPHSRICLITERNQYMHLPVPMPGEHQALNCGVALAVIDHLQTVGFTLDEHRVMIGLDRTRVPGRMEILSHRPRIIIDGAHNPIALSTLMRSIGTYLPADSMVCVFGCCEDKDVATMLETAARGGDKFVFTRARGNPRAKDPEELQRIFNERCGKMSQVADTLPEAIDLALRAAGRDDLILVTGSFYLIGEARKHFMDIEKRRVSSQRS